MKYTSTLTSKGQVTVPLPIRRRLGLRQGDRIEFATQGESIIIRPARETPNPFEPYAGALGTFPGGIGEINAWMKDLRNSPRRRRSR